MTVSLATYGGFQHPRGFTGQQYNLANATTITDYQVGLAMPAYLTYGLFVKRQSDGSIVPITAVGDKTLITGITIRYVNRIQDYTDGTCGWRLGDKAPVMSLGFIYVATFEDVKPGDPVFYNPTTPETPFGKSNTGGAFDISSDWLGWDRPSDESEIAGLKLGVGH